MYRDNRFLALIPARAGSKGLKNKNIRILRGKPLIAYTIEAALESGVFERVVVSTESEEIAAIATRHGAEVPFVRPAELTTDTASITHVLLHALDFFREQKMDFTYLSLLQPTSPLRTSDDIRVAADLILEKDANAIVSICETDHPPAWSNTLPANGSMDGFMNKEIRNLRRQDLPRYYRVNGAVYIARVDYFRRFLDWFVEGSCAYIMPPERSIDIDTEFDLKFCECLMGLLPEFSR